MNTPSKDHELYLAYRLRELPLAERDAIDHQLLADNEFSDRMQAAEYDLLDDYRANRLTSDVRGRVKRAFSREELRQPSYIPQTNVAHRAELRRPSARFSLAFRITCTVAASVLVAVAGWLIALHLHPASSSRSAVARTSVALSLPRNSGDSSTQIVDSSSHPPDETAVLLLAPAVTRGGTSAQLELRPSTRSIKVQWLVPSHLAGRTFSLLIQRNGKDVALVPASNMEHIDGSNVEEFSLSRAVFSAGEMHAQYAFFVRKSGSLPATEAEFAVRVSEDSGH